MAKPTLAHAWVQQVARSTDDDLPDYVRRGILACGAPAGELLRDLLTEPSSWDTMVAEHAIVLLGELRHEPAIEDLADMLWDEPAWQPVVHEALLPFGDKAVPQLLRALRLGFPGVMETVVALTAGQGRRDVREAVEHVLQVNPEAVVGHLAKLRDPALIPAIRAAFDRLDETDPHNRRALILLAAAVLELGGELTEGGRERIATARKAAERHQAKQARRRRSRKRKR